ncbi:MAG: glycoside hydrolase 43 family protein [Bacteroidaceae bacterium]|nr:glycoside hydrolase 43 family protein [Bacteroidaceae bacterium]
MAMAVGAQTIENPIIFADFPDPDVIRMGDTYYMVSTTMHFFPGATIVKSKDLVNWEYCSQPLEELSDGDNYSLRNGRHAYARGMWACSMKEHGGKVYLMINGNDTGGWLLTATTPEGPWQKRKLSRIYYDPGMLFDNGKVYVACGIGNIQMCELDEDFNYIREQNVVRDKQGLEGCHLYKIGDYYYIYATYGGWPSGQTVFRSKDIFGPYEERLLLDKMIDGRPNTIHQGALFDTPTGQWWTIMQQDLGCLGRMPNLLPVRWEEGWPVVKLRGEGQEPSVERQSFSGLPTSDEFDSATLGMPWQWNHNPDNSAWSLSERPGWLRLKAMPADRLTQTRNMLTQRIFADRERPSEGTVRIDVRHLKEGDRAGICILQDPYAMIAVEKKKGKKRIVWSQDQLTNNRNFTPATAEASDKVGKVVYLRATIDYRTSKTQFYYSTDGKQYKPLGGQTTLGFNLTMFSGARFGLFCYSSSQQSNGYAEFDYFSAETDN